jgi:hypothetical protein
MSPAEPLVLPERGRKAPDYRGSSESGRRVRTATLGCGLGVVYRQKRASWFAVVGSLQRAMARRLIARYASDGPLAVRRSWGSSAGTGAGTIDR